MNDGSSTPSTAGDHASVGEMRSHQDARRSTAPVNAGTERRSGDRADGSSADNAGNRGEVVSDMDVPGIQGDLDNEPTDRDDRDPVDKSSASRNFVEWVVVIAIALAVALLVRTFLLAHFQVEGTSMLDTVHPGDRVLVNKTSYRLGDPERGDVVVLHELGGERDLIKRIIGLPGETIRIEDCVVLVDEQPIDEPYLSPEVANDPNWCQAEPVSVGANEVYVLGDNRVASADSRVFGPVDQAGLVGRAFVVFFPFGDAQWL